MESNRVHPASEPQVSGLTEMAPVATSGPAALLPGDDLDTPASPQDPGAGPARASEEIPTALPHPTGGEPPRGAFRLPDGAFTAAYRRGG